MAVIGINSIGCYVPYYYMNRKTIAQAWGTKGKIGSNSMANVDEDSITMSVEAASECLRFQSKETIDALFFASVTGPYAEKSHATLVSTALDLGGSIFVSDFGASMRSAASALRAGYGEVLSGASNNVLITASDVRNGYPKSSQEEFFGDAAAAVSVGRDDVIATIDCFLSVQNEIHDMWRNRGDVYVRTAEGRFAAEEGYEKPVGEAVDAIRKKTGLEARDFDKVVLTSPGAGESAKMARKLGIKPERLQDNFVSSIGVTGVPQAFLMLSDALERSHPGERILMIVHGGGADAFVFTVTENVRKIKNGNSIAKYLERRREFNEYGRFLSFRRVLEAVPGEPYKIPPSTSRTWREQETFLKLLGSECKKCGTTMFPMNRVCGNCGSLDDFSKIENREKIAKLFTCSVDYLAGRSDDPIVVQAVVEDTRGTRFYMNMTDFAEEEITIGMDLEFTFRKIHDLGDFPNYFWKVRPVRRKKAL